MRKILFLLPLALWQYSFGQDTYNDYLHFYPIADDPNIKIRPINNYKYQHAEILFEANPIVRYNFINNYAKNLQNSEDRAFAFYLSYRPQLRMYTTLSLPVITPSNKLLGGTQQTWRMREEKDKLELLSFSLETGHFSNGQDDCAFARGVPDGSAACDSVYNLITSSTNLAEILNRRSGNFSTNLTELIINYRFYTITDHYRPKKMHSLNVGSIFYHDRLLGVFNIGGYSDEDIRIYGRWRFLLEYEYLWVFEGDENRRISGRLKVLRIQKPHNSVEPWRVEGTITYYPWEESKSLGIFADVNLGHDDYNFRFVDSGTMISLGIAWDQFPQPKLKRVF